MTIFVICFVAGILLSIFETVLLFPKQNIVFSSVIGVCLYFCIYVLGSVFLFISDIFTLNRAVAVTGILCSIGVALTAFFEHRKKGTIHLTPDLSIKPVCIPIIISIICLPLIMNKNELFGMGQDQGVYQVVAINILNGLSQRQHDFAEYHLLTNSEAQATFTEFVHSNLVGYDISPNDYPDTVYDRNISPVSGIYHGIPTYPAMLALFAKLFGISNMINLQTVFWIGMIFIVHETCRNMNCKASIRVLACALSACAPVVIWVAKSSLTEMFLAVILTLFIFFLTDKKYEKSKWLSILPIIIFGFYHVSFYTILPVFLIIYAGLYLFKREKAYGILLISSVVIYAVSFFSMRHMQPFYTMNNYRNIFVFGINVFNLPVVVSIVCAVLLLFTIGYVWLLKRKSIGFSSENFCEKAKNCRLAQIFIILLLVLPTAYCIIKAILNVENLQELRYVTVYGFVVQTGLLLIPVAMLTALFKTKKILQSPEILVSFAMFVYCILIYSALLRPSIQYYYYYSRYMAPFIPVAVIFGAVMLNTWKKRTAISSVLITAVGILSLSPYTHFIASEKDDTRSQWQILEDITSIITADDCLIIDNNLAPAFYLPIRNITGADSYPIIGDIQNQMENYSKNYSHVYYLTNDVTKITETDNYSCKYYNTVHHSEDDLTNSGNLFVLPTDFLKYDEPICLYRFLTFENNYPASEYTGTNYIGFGTLENDFCWSTKENAQVKCSLKPDDYTLTVELGCSIPLDAIKKEKIIVDISINGKSIGKEEITKENNGKSFSIEVPEKVLTDKQNTVTFSCDLWNASDFQQEDNRKLGIPIKSLCFTRS
ncbi:MAG: hypothetical protein IJZ64_06585 [Ruminococcus sp.]|nr:hypothetical protein [Ruminococcus sp.]